MSSSEFRGGPAVDGLFQAFEDLFAAQRRLRGRDTKIEDGVGLPQFRLMRALARKGPLPSTHLAAAVGIAPASATQMLDALEKRRFVRRSRSQSDRRVVTVDLTDDGRRVYQARRQVNRALFEQSVADLSPDDLATGTEVLRRCAAYLDAL